MLTTSGLTLAHIHVRIGERTGADRERGGGDSGLGDMCVVPSPAEAIDLVAGVVVGDD